MALTGELSAEEKHRLLRDAMGAIDLAYSPYSQNKVGAALLTSEGRVFLGANIGNACSTLNCCSEQAALVQAVLAGCTGLVAIAVLQSSAAPCVPCGRCLQLLAEFSPAMLILSAEGDRTVEWRLDYLLPVPFRRSERPVP